MTNSVYFYAVKRDAYSTCSSSSSLQSPDISQRQVRNKWTVKSRFTSFLGFKQKVVSNDGDFKNFSLEELKTATGNLLTQDSSRVDGEFKGWISQEDLTPTEPENGIAVVVKLGDTKTFQYCEDEAPYLGQLSHHPNLVKFYGHCLDGGRRLYVFEFLPHTLGDYLFQWASLPLPWSLRMKVALGVAKGLAFLHRAHVIYREFSTSNIHLDTNYNAKLSDFGLSKDCLSGDRSRAAPGYYATGHQTAKIDVYSFGILLLEMISGRQSSEFEEHDKTTLATRKSHKKKLEDEFIEEQHMVKCLRPHLDANISHIVDHRLEGRYTLKSAEKVAKLASKCLAMEATMRPDMDQAVAELEQLQDSKYTKFIGCEEFAMRKYQEFVEYEMKQIGIEELPDLSDSERLISQDMEDEFFSDAERLNSEDMEDEFLSDTERPNFQDMEDEFKITVLIEEDRDSLLLDGVVKEVKLCYTEGETGL